MKRPLASSACWYSPRNGAPLLSTTSRPPTRPWHARPLPAAPLHATLRPNAPPVNPATTSEVHARLRAHGPPDRPPPAHARGQRGRAGGGGAVPAGRRRGGLGDRRAGTARRR